MSTMATTAIRLAAAEREMQTWQERFEDSRRNIDLLEIDCGRLHLANPDPLGEATGMVGRSLVAQSRLKYGIRTVRTPPHRPASDPPMRSADQCSMLQYAATAAIASRPLGQQQ